MKAKFTRKNFITLLVIAILISLAVFYNSRYGRPKYARMEINSAFSSSKKKVDKPDIWFENFWGGKKKNDPSKIRR